MSTPVIFRKWRDTGEIIALFPREAATVGKPWLCSSYMSTGQHSAADPQIVHGPTVKPKDSEIRPLARELRRIGYRLVRRFKFSQADFEARQDQLRGGSTP